MSRAAKGARTTATKEQVDQMIQMGGATSNATVDNQGSDITHTNAVSYNPKTDQIVISVPGYSEIMVIDHSTTTAEAKGSSGGNGAMAETCSTAGATLKTMGAAPRKTKCSSGSTT